MRANRAALFDTTCSSLVSLRQTAFREFRGKPIYSEANLNCDKHKMERFFKVPTYLPTCSLPSL
jgi:hypothetical protein